jgi:hypothetical protein
MKKVLSIAFIFLFVQAYSQTYTYKFSIKNVSNRGEAKAITDPLRDNFKTFPTFNPDTKYFEFTATEKVTEEKLNAILDQKGYRLLSYQRTEVIKPEQDNKSE